MYVLNWGNIISELSERDKLTTLLFVYTKTDHKTAMRPFDIMKLWNDPCYCYSLPLTDQVLASYSAIVNGS